MSMVVGWLWVRDSHVLGHSTMIRTGISYGGIAD